MRIQVIGAGNMGTALAVHLARNRHKVTLYTIDSAVAKQLRAGENKKYLPGIKIPKTITISEKIIDAPVSVICVPTKALFDVAKKLSGKLITPCKGLINDKPITQAIPRMTILQGPTDAEEIAHEKPAIGVISGPNAALAKKILASKNFEIIIEKDAIGAQMGGAFKNAIAILAGMQESNENKKGHVIVEGLKEIMTLATKMGAKKETILGPAGLGDLIMTCYDKHSRNREFGELIAKGKKYTGCQTVEGIETTKAMARLAKKYRVKLPLIEGLAKRFK